MADSFIVIPRGLHLKLVDNGDGTYSLATASGGGGQSVSEATGVTLYTVTLTNADTEYSQALPAGTKAFAFRCRSAVDVRFAFETGKVATPTDPYRTLPSGQEYYKEAVNLTGKILYLASSTAGVVVEIEAWT